MDNPVLPSNLADLIFQLGRLQVFHYPTVEESATGAISKNVYWQDSVSRNTYGPFPSIYESMQHYTWIVQQQKNENKMNADLIQVDFKRKKRLIFDLP